MPIVTPNYERTYWAVVALQEAVEEGRVKVGQKRNKEELVKRLRAAANAAFREEAKA